MDIETQSRLLELKGILNGIGHASFSYSRIEKQHPMHTLDDATAKQVIEAYEKILAIVRNIVHDKPTG